MKFSCALETSSEQIRLVNVILPLTRAGYQLISQRIEPSGNGGNLIHVIAKSQDSKSQADLIEDLSSIQGCTLYTLEIEDSDLQPMTSLAAKKIDQKEVLTVIGAQYPNIVDVVKQYENSLGSNERETALHDLGRKVGGGIYQRDYALGSPLKKEVSIARELIPALKDFCKVRAGDHSVTLNQCPFCRSSDDNHSGCHFVVGYIEGFLASNPAIKRVKVEETSCGAGNSNICEFTIW